MFAIKLFFAGIGPMIEHWSIGLIVIALCVVGELFVGTVTGYMPFLAPATRQIKLGLLVIAAIAASILLGEYIGAKDATGRCDAKAAAVTGEVHKQVQKAQKNPGVDKFEDDSL